MKLDKEQLEEKVFKGGLIQPENAVNTGLVDGFMNVDDILSTFLVMKTPLLRTVKFSK